MLGNCLHNKGENLKNYLYINSINYKNIAEYLETNDGVFESEEMEKAFDYLGLRNENDAIQIIKFWKESRSEMDRAKSEIERIKKYLDQQKSNMETAEKLLRMSLDCKDASSIGTGLDSVSYAKLGDCLPPAEEIDEELIPDEFWKEIPASRHMMRGPILKAVKSKELEGIALVTGRKRLKIV